MKVHSKALLVASLTMTLAACSSTPAGPGPAPDTPIGGTGAKVEPPVQVTPPGQMEVPSQSGNAQTIFVTQVFPALSDPDNNERCSNCHAVGTLGAPPFLAGSPQNAYKVIREYNGGALIAVPERNLLLLKSQHEGPQLDGAQRGAIDEWLKAEYPGRPAVPIEESLYDSLDNFATCMVRQQFADQAGQIFNTQLSGVLGVTCNQCHDLAQAPINGGNFVLDPDVNITFDNAKKFPGILKYVAPTVSNTGVFTGLAESLRIERRGNEFNLQGSTKCANEAQEVADVQAGKPLNVFDPLYCHPNYKLANVQEDSLHLFVEDTRNRAKNQVCTDDNTPL